MPWLKCSSCPRVILVPEDTRADTFLCENCKPLLDLVWSDEWPVGMTMNMNEYKEFQEKMRAGNPELKHGE